jgi:1-acyl-sn-glycerol-3-phosphate acyltransferase
MSATGSPSPAPHPESGTVRGVWRAMVRAPLCGLVRVGLRLRTEGLDNIPPDGRGVLVVSNHVHNADPVLLEIVFTRPLHFMAKEELFKFRPLGLLLSSFGNFPVARGKSDRKAVRAAINRLQNGVAVGMFPEGTRSKTMRLSQAHAGAGLIAIQGGVPILPVAITGSERLPLNGHRPSGMRPTPAHGGIRIRIGEPFRLPETGSGGRRLNAAEATERMMHAIADLLPEDYRGIYASSESSEAHDRSASASSAARMN